MRNDEPAFHAPVLGPDGEPCRVCAAPLARDQRYCLECGRLRAERRLDPLHYARGDSVALPAAPALAEELEPLADPGGVALPAAALALGRPRIAAAASLVLLGFGTILGVAAGPRTPDSLAASSRRIVLAMSPAVAAPAAAPATALGELPVASDVASSTASPAVDLPLASTPAATPTPAATTPDSSAGPGSGDTTPAAPTSPAPVKHVWLIALSGHTMAQALATGASGASGAAGASGPSGATGASGPAASAPYLAQLAAQGTLLDHYSSIAPGSLANAIALISGQRPNAQTLAECPRYTALAPGRIGKDGLVSGAGCRYPPRAVTLPDELTGAGLTWRGYFEDIGAAPAPAPTSCRHPEPGQDDPFAAPRPGDAYLTRRDPFVFFRSISESAECGSNVLGLERLAPDLATGADTPAFSYVAPSACHDGSDVPCADGVPSGLAAADAWLSTTVPAILASPAYADGGLVVVTFDGVAGPPEAGPSPVGALLLSPYVAAGSTVSAHYDHRSLLKTLTHLYGVPALGEAAARGTHAFGARVFANVPAPD